LFVCLFVNCFFVKRLASWQAGKLASWQAASTGEDIVEVFVFHVTSKGLKKRNCCIPPPGVTCLFNYQ
jgi:hypothetical protein